MRLLILSDLHHEQWGEHAPVIDPAISRPDVVILAGDINTGDKAVRWAAANFREAQVVYVHGNHEGYGHHLDKVQRDIQAQCVAAGSVHFLNCNELIIDRVRFLGATLWTDFRLFGDDTRAAAMREAEAVMNDYKRIRLANQGYRKLRAADTAQFHTLQRSWIERKLAEPFDGKTVVVTHMAPSRRSVTGRYSEDLVSAAYASRLDTLAEGADFWIHGHMHDSVDYTLGKCRVLSNPCGYMIRGGSPENGQFDPNYIVEITL